MSGGGRKSRIEGHIAGGIIAAIIVVGAFLLRQELRRRPGVPVEPRQAAAARFSEGSLDHVADELIHYRADRRFASGLQVGWGLALGNHDDLYACGEGGIRHLSRSGDHLGAMASKETVRFVTVDGDDRIYAVIGSRVDIFSADGAALGSWREFGDNASLTALALTPSVVFVADRNARVVWRCDRDGKILGQLGSEKDDRRNGLNIPGPYLDLFWGRDSMLYVSNPGRHNVNGYTIDGELKTVVGHPSFRHDGFCGCCNPVAVAQLDGKLVTSEKGIARVKILSLTGSLDSIVAAPVDFGKFKHSFAIDIQVADNGDIYLLENGNQEIVVYRRKEGMPPAQCVAPAAPTHDPAHHSPEENHESK